MASLSFFCFLARRNQIKNTNAARTAIPPTTPPAIAGVLDGLAGGVGEGDPGAVVLADGLIPVGDSGFLVPVVDAEVVEVEKRAARD